MAAGIAIAALAATAGPAGAGTVSVGGSNALYGWQPQQRLLYEAGAGERNDLHIRVEQHQPSPDRLIRTAIVTDRVEITAGPGCDKRPGDPRSATCDVTEHWDFSFEAVLGDGDDRAIVETELFQLAVLRGQGGGDRLTGSPGARNLLVGGDGDDVMTGGAQSDVFAEGSRRNGGDSMHGGDGQEPDWVDYSDRRRAIRADTAGDRDDGERGERDQLVGVEALVGGAGPDRLTGGPAAEHLIGGPGGDVLAGNGGDDFLVARWRPPDVPPRRQPVRGPKDRLTGGGGDDALYADGGGDTLAGGAGVDTLVGGGGADRMLASDGATDEIDCQGGRDRLIQDRLDVHVSCERHRPQSRAAIPLAAAAFIEKYGSRLVSLRVGCPSVGERRCAGTVRFVSDGRVLHERRFEHDLSRLGDDFAVPDELWQALQDRDPRITVVAVTDGLSDRPIAVPAISLRDARSLGYHYLPVEIPVGRRAD